MERKGMLENQRKGQEIGDADEQHHTDEGQGMMPDLPWLDA